MIFLSAGHYPSRPGVGFEGFFEHDEAVRWVDLMHEQISDISCIVPPGVLRTKVEFINNRRTWDSFALEVHFNSAKANTAPEGEPPVWEHIGRGCETLYYPGSKKGKPLAQVINDAMAKHMEPDRGIKEGWYQMNKDKGPNFFLARTACSAIIIEPDFIHRKDIIQQKREACCEAIACALKCEVHK